MDTRSRPADRPPEAHSAWTAASRRQSASALPDAVHDRKQTRPIAAPTATEVPHARRWSQMQCKWGADPGREQRRIGREDRGESALAFTRLQEVAGVQPANSPQPLGRLGRSRMRKY